MDTFRTRRHLQVGSEDLTYFSLPELAKRFPAVATLPYSLKILLENLLRREDGGAVKKHDIEALATAKAGDNEISFMPARVILQDFTGVPCIADLAAMRDGILQLGGDPDKVNPLQPVELVIDHSVQVDHFGSEDALKLNSDLEYHRNRERYVFLRWGQTAFNNFRVVPPETGIVHQVNIEYLARVVCKVDGVAFPDTVFGTDSHTTMVNGLGVVGWGVGGIEAEAAMLGQPSSMLIPQVLGFRLQGRMPEGATATDLVLTITEALRKKGVVGKFVEFFGPGLAELTIADRVTLGNMCPEYGATVAIFPIDDMTLEYLRFTGRDQSQVELVEAYAKAQDLFQTPDSPEAKYSDTLELDLATIVPSLAGPRRPQDRVALSDAKRSFGVALPDLEKGVKKIAAAASAAGGTAVATRTQLEHGSVVIAAITSCTNTSNPSVMIGAGLVAKKAAERGLTRKPWVKTSLAPGSKVVTEYLNKSGLTPYLNELGFNLVGYGCTTCIGNSGPLPEAISAEIRERGLVVASVLSGNRNFEGRIQQEVRANYLASPPLVVAYAIAGSMNIDLTTEPLGHDRNGTPVFLRDLWPTNQEIQSTMLSALSADMYREQYADVFKGTEHWQQLPVPAGETFTWEADSTYIRRPPFVENLSKEPAAPVDVAGARALAVLGDSITTDHISPAGSIRADSPAGKYLLSHGVAQKDFNSYGARRGNHEVMMRGTFANVRLKNQLAPGTEGGWTTFLATSASSPGLTGQVMSIYDAAMQYQAAGVPLVVLAGKEYGSGSSRDWAAKGAMLLGIKVVIAESFERIHRSNLVNMGVLPLQFMPGDSATALGLTGHEVFEFAGSGAALHPRGTLTVTGTPPDGSKKNFKVMIRVDTPEELTAFRHGGILPYVLRRLAASTVA